MCMCVVCVYAREVQTAQMVVENSLNFTWIIPKTVICLVLDSKNAPIYCMYVVCLRIFLNRHYIILHVYIDIIIMQYDMSYYHYDHV